MKEKGYWGVLEDPKNDPAHKYHSGNLSVVFKPLAYLDVSPDPLWGFFLLGAKG